MIKVFYLERTDKQRQSLRRYRNSKVRCDVCEYGYCNAHTQLSDATSRTSISFKNATDAKAAYDSWPTRCICGYEFADHDSWQLFGDTIYKRTDTGEEMTLREAPAGACWDAFWFTENRTPPSFFLGDDGRCLVIKTPAGEWMPDSRAKNCTMRDDNTHKCWIRHGSPEGGDLHIDKNGHTCAAGGGSILIGSYHAFCHNGFLIPC